MLKRHHAGKSLGVIIGSVGGWFGAVMGFVIGYMIDTLLAQRRTDRAIADYFENPGPSPFLERNPGSAAFCGLAALVLRENEKKEELDEALTASRIARLAAAVFAVDAEPREELEMFARVAAARAGELNPDLLTESLCARVRGRPGESRLRETVCEGLEGLAESALAVELSARVAALVQPVRKAKKRLPGDDPYEILGISRDAPEEEVKKRLPPPRRPVSPRWNRRADRKAEKKRRRGFYAHRRRVSANSIDQKKLAEDFPAWRQQPSERSILAPRPERRSTSRS